MLRLAGVALAVVVAVVASGCCCPCGYVSSGGVPDVAQAIRPEVAPRFVPQAAQR